MFKILFIRLMNGYCESLDSGNEDQNAWACRVGALGRARTAHRPSRVRARGACSRTDRNRCSSARTAKLPFVSRLRLKAAPEWPRAPTGTTTALVPRLLLMLRERSSSAAAELAARAGARPPALRSPPFLHQPASTLQSARSITQRTMS